MFIAEEIQIEIKGLKQENGEEKLVLPKALENEIIKKFLMAHFKGYINDEYINCFIHAGRSAEKGRRTFSELSTCVW